MSVSGDFQTEFSITALEARELLAKSQKLSKALVDLRNAYGVDLVTHTRDIGKKRRDAMGVKGPRKLYAMATTQLSRKAKALWKAYSHVQQSEDEFSTVWRLHRISGDLQGVITKTFEIRHEHSDLSNPETIVEGRRIYESLEDVLRYDTDLKVATGL